MAKRARPKNSRLDRKAHRPNRQPDLPATMGVAAPAPSRLPLPLPDAQAVSLFQQAMGALHQRQFARAAEAFRALLDRFPGERALLDRSRVYLELAERELSRVDVSPRTVEERLTFATAALNNDQDAEAERLVRSVLSDDPRHDLALYLMAAIEARRGDHDAAVAFLGRAISMSPEIRAQARHDADFDPLRRLQTFQALIELPPSTSSRRGKRLR